MTTRAERTARVLSLLAEKLGLPEPPGRIEAYDISNTGASDIVAAMTVFADGKPKKSAYRYFLLRDLDGPDDYASIRGILGIESAQFLSFFFRRQALHITDRLDPFLEGPLFQYCFFTCARILLHDVSPLYALLSQKYRSYAQKSIC